MTKVNFVSADGSAVMIDAQDGDSVLQNARAHDLTGVVGECGGGLVCATCHVYVDAEYLNRIDAVSDEEDEMLDVVAAGREPTSRLSCQIIVKPDLDGLTITFPPNQY